MILSCFLAFFSEVPIITAVGGDIAILQKKNLKSIFENPDFPATSDCPHSSSRAHWSRIDDLITCNYARYNIVYILHTLKFGLSETAVQMVITSLH